MKRKIVQKTEWLSEKYMSGTACVRAVGMNTSTCQPASSSSFPWSPLLFTHQSVVWRVTLCTGPVMCDVLCDQAGCKQEGLWHALARAALLVP
jgi:hypothetical protein